MRPLLLVAESSLVASISCDNPSANADLLRYGVVPAPALVSGLIQQSTGDRRCATEGTNNAVLSYSDDDIGICTLMNNKM